MDFIYIYIYIYIYISVCVRFSGVFCVCVRVCDECLRVSVCLNLYSSMYIYICIFINLYDTCDCLCVCMLVCLCGRVVCFETRRVKFVSFKILSQFLFWSRQLPECHFQISQQMLENDNCQFRNYNQVIWTLHHLLPKLTAAWSVKMKQLLCNRKYFCLGYLADFYLTFFLKYNNKFWHSSKN